MAMRWAGWCECVLATDDRLATPGSAHRSCRKPNWGIMPASGGSVRMPRTPGVYSALEIIAACRCRADQALKIGLVGWRSQSRRLIEGAMAILRQAINGDLTGKRNVSRAGTVKTQQIESYHDKLHHR
ncbi:hypothetical protein ACLB1Q_20935 [Escherichia coli]